ncbi:MAG: serine/threonine protein phosphatase PrpC [Candidatus Promineifilaceae bacterium]|jgi:serine/threonine protein phosphatase PrpC
MSYNLTAGAHTDVGKRRDHNEDYFYRSDLDEAVKQADGALFIAADGVGGNRGGADASRIACEQLPKHFFNPAHKEMDLTQRLSSAIDLTHYDIRTAAEADPLIGEMSCTIVILAIAGGKAITAHLGDARIYRLMYQNASSGTLTQITKDHSWVQEQVDIGLLTTDQAAAHRNRNVVTRTLGGVHKHPPEIKSTSLHSGDRYLLCSDGLHGPVEHADLTHWMLQETSLDIIAENLIDHANLNGGPDNIVAVLVQIGALEKQVGAPTEKIIVSRQKLSTKTVMLRPLATVASDHLETPTTPRVQPALSSRTGRSGYRGAVWGIVTVLFLAVCTLLVWLFLFSDDQSSNGSVPITSTPPKIAAVIVIPTSLNNSAAVASTSTRAPEATATETPIPTNTMTLEVSTATAATDEAQVSENSGTKSTAPPVSDSASSTQTSSPATATLDFPPLRLLDIRCDGKHVFEPNAEINFKWLGKESAALENGEWMQIAIQSATKPEGIVRQITDAGSNILPEPTQGEWLVPRKLSSFGIVGDGDLNWWVEYVVDDAIIASSNTGCFRVIPKEGQ